MGDQSDQRAGGGEPLLPLRKGVSRSQGNCLTLLQQFGQRLEKPASGFPPLAAEFLRVRDKRGRLVPLRPNQAQARVLASWGQRNIILKARQMGITTLVAAQFFLRTMTTPGTLSVLVAHDQRSAEEIFRIAHRFLENLPEWLRRGALRTSRANVRQLVFPALDSQYRVETAADPEAGRGLTIQNLHCSEVARWPGHGAETLASLRAAVAPAGTVVLESTPNGVSGCFYDEWKRAPETGYVRHFLPWWIESSYTGDPVDPREFTEEEHGLAIAQRLSGEQIGFRRSLRANFRGLAAQEFAEDAESCFLASGECVFDVPALERRLLECVDLCAARQGRVVEVWYPAVAGKEYVIGVDAAGGGADGDYACAQVIDRESGLQCAELHGHLNPEELARAVARLAREYNDAIIAVERNNHGHGVHAYLTAANRYERLYERGGSLGWPTNAVTRPQMVALVASVIDDGAKVFNSAELLRECRTFARGRDGIPRALGSAHDDRVMAMAIALAVREELLIARRERGPRVSALEVDAKSGTVPGLRV